MMASGSAAPCFPPERASQARFLVGAEAAFRNALTDSIEGLELCDRNMLRFHYFHGLTARLAVDKHGLDHLVDRARSRLDLAITRVLRA